MKKNVLIFMCCSLVSSGVVAKNYKVETGSDDIACSLKTLTKENMLKMTGNFGTLAVEKGQTRMAAGSMPPLVKKTYYDTINPFMHARENLMMVLVKLTNNSSEDIYLPHGEYFEGMGSTFIEKSVFSGPYKGFICDSRWKFAKFLLPGLGVSAVGLGAFLVCTALVLLDDDVSSKLLGVLGAFASLIPFTVGAKLLRCGCRHYSNIGYRKNKMKEVVHSTKVDGKANSKPSPSGYYKIPPGGTFADILLVDLNEEGVSRDIFDRIPPKLSYEAAV